MITNYFSKATPEEAAEQATRGFEAIRHSSAWERARKEASHLDQARRERELAAARQRDFRRKKYQTDAKLGLRDPKTFRLVKVRKSTLFSSAC